MRRASPWPMPPSTPLPPWRISLPISIPSPGASPPCTGGGRSWSTRPTRPAAWWTSYRTSGDSTSAWTSSGAWITPGSDTATCPGRPMTASGRPSTRRRTSFSSPPPWAPGGYMGSTSPPRRPTTRWTPCSIPCTLYAFVWRTRPAGRWTTPRQSSTPKWRPPRRRWPRWGRSWRSCAGRSGSTFYPATPTCATTASAAGCASTPAAARAPFTSPAGYRRRRCRKSRKRSPGSPTCPAWPIPPMTCATPSPPPS